jgi:hypothetical protein
VEDGRLAAALAAEDAGCVSSWLGRTKEIRQLATMRKKKKTDEETPPISG